MNAKYKPELHWPLGYPFAIVLMPDAGRDSGDGSRWVENSGDYERGG